MPETFDVECDLAEKKLFRDPKRLKCKGCKGYFYAEKSSSKYEDALCPTCNLMMDLFKGGECGEE